MNKKITLNYFLPFYLLLLLGTYAVLLIPNTTGDRDNTFFTIFSSAILIFGLITTLFLTRKIDKKFLATTSLLTATTIVSQATADAQLKSIVYFLVLTSNFIFAYVISKHISIEQLFKKLLYTILLLILASIILYALSFESVKYIDHHQRPTVIGTDPIRGLFAHKVMASLYAVTGLTLSLYFLKKWKLYIAISVISLFILLTGSSTGILLATLVPLLFLFYKIIFSLKLSKSVFTLFLLILISGIATLLHNSYEYIFLALGRDSTLTGRTYLWEWALYAWAEKPIFGWGYLGYFDSPHYHSFSGRYPSFENYEVPHFHNSLLQVLVDFGLSGAIILFYMTSKIFSSLYDAAAQNKGQCIQFYLVILFTIYIIASMTMHIFFNYNHAVSFLMFYLFCHALNSKENNPNNRQL